MSNNMEEFHSYHKFSCLIIATIAAANDVLHISKSQNVPEESQTHPS